MNASTAAAAAAAESLPQDTEGEADKQALYFEVFWATVYLSEHLLLSVSWWVICVRFCCFSYIKKCQFLFLVKKQPEAVNVVGVQVRVVIFFSSILISDFSTEVKSQSHTGLTAKSPKLDNRVCKLITSMCTKKQTSEYIYLYGCGSVRTLGPSRITSSPADIPAAAGCGWPGKRLVGCHWRLWRWWWCGRQMTEEDSPRLLPALSESSEGSGEERKIKEEKISFISWPLYWPTSV